MAEPARSFRPDVASSGVVQPLSRAAARRCSRPGCPTPATATLTFAFGDRLAVLTPLEPDGGPETYDLCRDHADRTSPPLRWTLRDDRPEDLEDVPPPEDLGSAHTVAVLAAALHGDDPAARDALDAPNDPAASDVAIDPAALDAIVDAPVDQVPTVERMSEPIVELDEDLLGARDEADPPASRSTDALGELSALATVETPVVDEPIPPTPDLLHPRPRSVPAADRHT